MTGNREEVLRFVEDMIPGVYTGEVPRLTFGAEIADLSLDHVYGGLWMRPGLSRRDRSLVTLGILITLRATSELQYHFPIAVRNGLSNNEIAEVIYHATGYAGFPAANTARAVAEEVLAAQRED